MCESRSLYSFFLSNYYVCANPGVDPKNYKAIEDLVQEPIDKQEQEIKRIKINFSDQPGTITNVRPSKIAEAEMPPYRMLDLTEKVIQLAHARYPVLNIH